MLDSNKRIMPAKTYTAYIHNYSAVNLLLKLEVALRYYGLHFPTLIQSKFCRFYQYSLTHCCPVLIFTHDVDCRPLLSFSSPALITSSPSRLITCFFLLVLSRNIILLSVLSRIQIIISRVVRGTQRIFQYHYFSKVFTQFGPL